MKKYDSVIRLGKTATDFHEIGDMIVVQEKLDGANASFEKDGDHIKAYSRNKELDSENTLNGFYSYVLQNVDIDLLNEDYIYYGEWLTRHKIDYKENLNTFFLFDVFDKNSGRYLNLVKVEKIAEQIKVKTVPVFYYGKFKSFKDIYKFVGKSLLNKNEDGEGVVLKNESRDDVRGNQTYVKIVSKSFLEKQKVKTSPKQVEDLTPETLELFQYLTPSRIEKQIFKKNEEDGILYAFENFSLFMKGMGQSLLEDILKEEGDEINEGYSVEAFFKKVGHVTPPILRQIIKDKTEFVVEL